MIPSPFQCTWRSFILYNLVPKKKVLRILTLFLRKMIGSTVDPDVGTGKTTDKQEKVRLFS